MSKNLKFVIFILITGTLSYFGGQHSGTSVHAHHAELSDTIYQYQRLMEEQRYDTANQLLVQHQEEMKQFITNRVPSEFQSEFNDLFEDNIKIIQDESMANHVKQNYAMSLLLAVDAVSNSSDPILTKWSQSMKNSLQAMVEQKSVNETELKQVLSNWDTMKLAMGTVIDNEQFNQLVESYNELAASDELSRQEKVEEVYGQLDEITTSSTVQQDGLTFTWMLLIVGGFITMTLSYVAWKKYKAEKTRGLKQPLS